MKSCKNRQHIVPGRSESMQPIQTDPRESQTEGCHSTCLYPRQTPRALRYSVKATIATRKSRRPCPLEGSRFLRIACKWGSSDFKNQTPGSSFRALLQPLAEESTSGMVLHAGAASPATVLGFSDRTSAQSGIPAGQAHVILVCVANKDHDALLLQRYDSRQRRSWTQEPSNPVSGIDLFRECRRREPLRGREVSPGSALPSKQQPETQASRALQILGGLELLDLGANAYWPGRCPVDNWSLRST